MRLENNEFTYFLIENCRFDIFGSIVKIKRNMDFKIINNFFNMDMLSSGFRMFGINCNYPEAQIIGEGLF